MHAEFTLGLRLLSEQSGDPLWECGLKSLRWNRRDGDLHAACDRGYQSERVKAGRHSVRPVIRVIRGQWKVPFPR